MVRIFRYVQQFFLFRHLRSVFQPNINEDNTKECCHKRAYCTLIYRIIIALGRIMVSWKETIHSKTCISGICVRLSRVRIFPGILGAHQQMIKYQSIINAFWHGRDVPVPQIQSIRKERWRRSWRSASDLFLCPPPNNLQVWKTAMPFDGMCWRFPSVTGDRPSGCNGNWSVGSVMVSRHSNSLPLPTGR